MNDDLRELYQEVILDHARGPRNFGDLEGATARAHGNNPLCGDQLTVYLAVDGDGRVRDVAFKGHGCAISLASASLMTEALKGKSETQARALFEAFHAMCTGRDTGTEEGPGEVGVPAEELEKLRVLSGVAEYPTRVKCATLAWHTMAAALDGEDAVTTE